ncbi:hypothetical protein ACQP25_17410 [Microtetraspora malaysiensis]|uniref:hypothetical protein n=1 Tax=Microtetraspora malaysiensis TaxID=161358 RepID=UPI003D91861F
MPTRPTRREGRRARFNNQIRGAATPKESFQEALRYLQAELADLRNNNEPEGDRLYAHYAAELRVTADEINRRRR